MGKINLKNQTDPATPASGYVVLFTDSSDKLIKTIDDAGLLKSISELSADPSPELAGNLNLNNYNVGYDQQAITYNSGTTTIDWSAGANQARLVFGAGNIANLEFTDPSVDCNVMLILKQDGVGSRLVSNWDAKVDWGDAGAPALSTGANKIDLFTFNWSSDDDLYLASYSLGYN